MKLQILSDLHIDSYARQSRSVGQIPKTDADMLLVAGDTANSDSGMPWLQEQAARLQVPLITIAGNHEYFNEDVLHFDKKLATWDNYNDELQQGVKLLQCQYIDIGDIRILGCTLWTDYQYQANVVIDRQANAPSVEEAVYGATATNVHDETSHSLDEGATLTKKKRDY